MAIVRSQSDLRHAQRETQLSVASDHLGSQCIHQLLQFSIASRHDEVGWAMAVSQL